MAWKAIVGRSFDAAGFDAYCRTLAWTTWRPNFIVLHNTGSPNLAQRPGGLTQQHIKNLEGYYRDTKHWSAGPHLFIDDKQIWVFTPLTTAGVHSPSWNSVALGIEMLGDYAADAFDSGRGKAVRDNTVAAIATLSEVLGLDPDTMKLHKEDTATTHDCPGKNVSKAAVIAAVKARIAADTADHAPDEPHPEEAAAEPLVVHYSAKKPTDAGFIARAKALQVWLATHDGVTLTDDGWPGQNTSNAYRLVTGHLLPGDPRLAAAGG